MFRYGDRSLAGGLQQFTCDILQRREFLPESHLSHILASKIFFTGRAVNLLQRSAATAAAFQSNLHEKEAYKYLSQGYLSLGLSKQDEADHLVRSTESSSKHRPMTETAGQSLNTEPGDENEDDEVNKVTTGQLPGGSDSLDHVVQVDSSAAGSGVSEVADDILDHINGCGFGGADIARFARRFERLVGEPIHVSALALESISVPPTLVCSRSVNFKSVFLFERRGSVLGFDRCIQHDFFLIVFLLHCSATFAGGGAAGGVGAGRA